MNLRLQLFFRIMLIGFICLVCSAGYVLYQTDQQAKLEADLTAQRIEKQLTQQLLKMFSRYDYSVAFPDTDILQQLNGVPGSCVQFLSRTESRRRSLCNEVVHDETRWPNWFGEIYQQLFNPSYEASRRFSFNAITYGSILVSLNVEMEIARAWSNLRAVFGILSVSILAVSLLVFMTINQLLRPAQLIVRGLEKMQQGELQTRIPSFEIGEWRRTSEAINALASTQQQIMNENRQLALKLINAQEEEHRFISRELHDEFGQCLAGINALTTSISQTARKDCPSILSETEGISHITAHMMSALRGLLTRLRPADVDEIGLTRSLDKLIKSWNQRTGGETRFTLQIDDGMDILPEPLPVNLYRIVQESLTNIAKHARASEASIQLKYVDPHQLILEVEDNGKAKRETLNQNMGVGLLGIAERVTALGGKITMDTHNDGGLKLLIELPVNPPAESLTENLHD
ncbi:MULTISPECIES: ATP-binding protein [unclassified Methylophaga]|uniref:sensor histidine kinase n=1 Tax=unclassified Methylophaga TaxID=2629249 RepID=UPI000C89A22D|nr:MULTISPECIES: ATP-binding protein [unclassified Methylophaga]MAK65825.1 sensor histidine kinase [Methylophaga sp.]MAY16550.1 sensor histidine kinase [Methylophaga sp.]MBN44949.1 sensor histidine kinase [Methylophaga sp.]HCD03976.1 sensor histidine kinase [Methylophaga sp.]